MGQPGGQHAGFAGTGPRKHQHGTVERFDRLPLNLVQTGKIGITLRGRHRRRGGSRNGIVQRVIIMERIGHGQDYTPPKWGD